MNISATEFLKEAFVIQEEDLSKLDEVFGKVSGDNTYEIKTSDGITREYNSIKDITNFENSASNPIVKFNISSHSIDPKIWASVSFENDSIHPIHYSLQGSGEELSDLLEEIKYRFEGMRPWYSKLAKADFVSYALILLVIIQIVAVIIGAFDLIPENGGSSQNENDSESRALFLVYLILGSTVFLGWVLNQIRKKLFPIGVFAIGQGRKRHELLEKIRWSVIIGGGLSLIITSIFSFF